MAASLIDGVMLAKRLNTRLKEKVAALAEAGIVPRLAVVLVGEHPPSQFYVRNKSRTARSLGIDSVEHRLEFQASEIELLTLIESLNDDRSIDGILIQLPLPPHIDVTRVLKSIDPQKTLMVFIQSTLANGFLVPEVLFRALQREPCS